MDHRFDQVPPDAESVVAAVKRQAEDECSADQLPAPVLDRCVRDAVAAFRGSPVTAFVPLFALRRVRCCIRAGTCECDDW